MVLTIKNNVGLRPREKYHIAYTNQLTCLRNLNSQKANREKLSREKKMFACDIENGSYACFDTQLSWQRAYF